MSHYFLGVDVGASKSQALIADARGRTLGWGTAAGGNPMDVGDAELTRVLQTATGEALAMADLAVTQISGAGMGIAGYDWPSQRAAILAAIRPLGLHAPLCLVNDALLPLLAGTAAGWGVAVVAGTSCNCWGWDRARRVGRMTGFAWLGEAAGAKELVGRALQAVAHQWTRRGPSTALTPALVARAGARDVTDLLEGLTLGRLQIGPQAAPLVFQVAAAGDTVAQELIVWAGCELASLALGVIRQLALESSDLDVVLAGSFFKGSPLLAEVMRERIHAVAPGARLVRLHVPPVTGGVLLGMAEAGLDPAPARATLLASVKEWE
jgi:N-acetylglucosamine kinase-like BadF-type ATPase